MIRNRIAQLISRGVQRQQTTQRRFLGKQASRLCDEHSISESAFTYRPEESRDSIVPDLTTSTNFDFFFRTLAAAEFELHIALTTTLDIKKKFYSIASVVQNDNRRYEIKLDKRNLKTPTGKRFEVENESLAQMIAQEWNGQQDTIKRTEMHLTSLMNTHLDNLCNLDKPQIIDSFVGQLSSDTLCYRAGEPEGERRTRSILFRRLRCKPSGRASP